MGPVEVGGTAPVIYRLADTVMPVGEASCGLVTLDNFAQLRQQSGEQAYATLAAELAALPATATRQVEVAVVGDFEFSGLSFAGGATPEATIAARMNIVDGIYTAQLGIKVVVAEVTVYRDAADPFTSTAVPSTLLSELGTWRGNTAAQRSRGLTHLLTGRDLEGTTVGIAYLGSLCSQRFGAGLTQGTLSEANSALVIAHEMGHNFGAPHDGETGSLCEATAQTFLMAPVINGSNIPSWPTTTFTYQYSPPSSPFLIVSFKAYDVDGLTAQYLGEGLTGYNWASGSPTTYTTTLSEEFGPGYTVTSGYDANEVAVPVEGGSWGSIKALYR